MIDYNLIHKSIEFYEKYGFTRIEAPWMVTEYIDSITRPKGAIPYRVENKKKNFVASGEQSFLYLYLKEYLPKGKFQTVTPCMRNDSFDYTHTKYFLKNELIITDKVDEENLKFVVHRALEFFRNEVFGLMVMTEKTEDGYDIVYKDVELGSYGIRECEFLTWIYGTGCAEPRTSRLLNKINIEEWATTSKK